MDKGDIMGEERPAAVTMEELRVRGHVAEIFGDTDGNWYWQWKNGLGHWGPFSSREECLEHLMAIPCARARVAWLERERSHTD